MRRRPNVVTENVTQPVTNLPPIDYLRGLRALGANKVSVGGDGTFFAEFGEPVRDARPLTPWASLTKEPNPRATTMPTFDLSSLPYDAMGEHPPAETELETTDPLKSSEADRKAKAEHDEILFHSAD